MESEVDFHTAVELILRRDARFRSEAYSFVMLATGFTVSRLAEPRHVKGQELLEGIRDFAIEQYGPMTKTVFEHWGLRSTLDFGHIVYNLIEAGLMSRTPTDRLEDFRDGFDFEKALIQDYPWGSEVPRT